MIQNSILFIVNKAEFKDRVKNTGSCGKNEPAILRKLQRLCLGMVVLQIFCKPNTPILKTNSNLQLIPEKHLHLRFFFFLWSNNFKQSQ